MITLQSSTSLNGFFTLRGHPCPASSGPLGFRQIRTSLHREVGDKAQSATFPHWGLALLGPVPRLCLYLGSSTSGKVKSSPSFRYLPLKSISLRIRVRPVVGAPPFLRLLRLPLTPLLLGDALHVDLRPKKGSR